MEGKDPLHYSLTNQQTASKRENYTQNKEIMAEKENKIDRGEQHKYIDDDFTAIRIEIIIEFLEYI